MQTIKKIGLHNSGSLGTNTLAKSSHLTLQQINQGHKDRDFIFSEMGFYVGYNVLVFPDGTWKQTRLIGEETCASRGSNLNTFHICLLGNFNKGSETPTLQQKDITKTLINAVISGYPQEIGLKVKAGTIINVSSKDIFPHRVLQPTTECYGTSLSDSWGRELVALNVPSQQMTLWAGLLELVQKMLALLLANKPLAGKGVPCSELDVKG